MCVCVNSSSLCSLGPCHGGGEWAGPSAGRAADRHVLWPSAPAHERPDRSMGAGSSGSPGLLQGPQWDPVLLSGGRTLTSFRKVSLEQLLIATLSDHSDGLERMLHDWRRYLFEKKCNKLHVIDSNLKFPHGIYTFNWRDGGQLVYFSISWPSSNIIYLFSLHFAPSVGVICGTHTQHTPASRIKLKVQLWRQTSAIWGSNKPPQYRLCLPHDLNVIKWHIKHLLWLLHKLCTFRLGCLYIYCFKPQCELFIFIIYNATC